MLFGKHLGTIGEDGRLTLPEDWRQQFRQGGILTLGADPCLLLFPRASFDQIADELEKLGIQLEVVRQWARYWAGSATDLPIDTKGRTIIPQSLRTAAGLDGSVTWLGVVGHAELWNSTKLSQVSAASAANISSIAQRVGDILQRTAHNLKDE